MRLTQSLWQHRQPMIRFLGRRSIPKQLDHTPQAHPASPESSLPESFAQYRNRAIQHGPLGGKQQSQSQTRASSSTAGNGAAGTSSPPQGHIGGHSAKELGPITAAKGEFMDRSQLPERFRPTSWSVAEIEAVESGGASLFT